MKMDIEILSRYTYIASVVAIYWIVSILTVFVNKALLSSKTVNLEAPLFVTWFQCIVSVVICVTLSNLSILFPNYLKFPNGDPFKKETIKKILPLSILFTAMIASNNLCLKYVGVAFYYVGRSLTTVFNVIFTYIILGQKTSIKSILCCTMIIAGFWLGVDQENVAGSLSVLGTILGVVGSLTLSLYSIHTKNVLPAFTIMINLVNLFFWGAMVIGGICGFAIGYVTALQIKVTSPLTHNVSGTAKACAQTILATYWFNERKSFLWWISNVIVLSSSAAYARFRQLDLNAEYKAERSLLKM
ncbi:hypothetical protein M0802_002928 [Mischocyttarus mexicanus]|nr:hypothetical protein M0802_002928 [Mischocyttarus mexicanus]